MDLGIHVLEEWNNVRGEPKDENRSKPQRKTNGLSNATRNENGILNS
jgi:hypothetical protein